jgi:hypothetical protein
MSELHEIGPTVGSAVLNEAMDGVQNPAVPIEDRAAMYGLLYEVKRRIDRALGTYIRKGPTAKAELAAHLATLDGEQLGPLYLGWESFDVTWPANDPENWADYGVQEELALIKQIAPDFVRSVPAHLELDTAALGEAVHMGDPVALQIHKQCKERGWRKEGGKRAVLKVRELPKEKAA